jgi:hypothetical protein
MSSLLGTKLFSRTAMLLIVLMSLISVVPKVDAGFVPSDRSLIPSLRDQDMQTVQKVLENKIITNRLEALGYSAAEIDQRLDQLSDKELHSLASQMESLAPGGDGVGFVIGILVIVLLVIVILKLLDRRIIIS